MRSPCEMARIDALAMFLFRAFVVLCRCSLATLFVFLGLVSFLSRSPIFLKQLESRVIFGSVLELLDGCGTVCLSVLEALLKSV